MFYGDSELKGVADKIPAIIDTGSSTLAIPAKAHNQIIDQIRE